MPGSGAAFHLAKVQVLRGPALVADVRARPRVLRPHPLDVVLLSAFLDRCIGCRFGTGDHVRCAKGHTGGGHGGRVLRWMGVALAVDGVRGPWNYRSRVEGTVLPAVVVGTPELE